MNNENSPDRARHESDARAYFTGPGDRRAPRQIPAATIESDAILADNLATEAALHAHRNLAAALETDLLMLRLREVGA